MKNWPAVLWVVFAAIVVLFASILSIMFLHYRAAHVLTHYGIWAIIFKSWFFYMSRGCLEVHIHHYTLMMIILSFVCYQDAFTTLLSGILNGVMIEGASMYGYDPIFIHFHPCENDRRSIIKKEQKKSETKIEN